MILIWNGEEIEAIDLDKEIPGPRAREIARHLEPGYLRGYLEGRKVAVGFQELRSKGKLGKGYRQIRSLMAMTRYDVPTESPWRYAMYLKEKMLEQVGTTTGNSCDAPPVNTQDETEPKADQRPEDGVKAAQRSQTEPKVDQYPEDGLKAARHPEDGMKAAQHPEDELYASQRSRAEPKAARQPEDELYASQKSRTEPKAARHPEDEPKEARQPEDGPKAAQQSGEAVESRPRAARRSRAKQKAAQQSIARQKATQRSKDEPPAGTILHVSPRVKPGDARASPPVGPGSVRAGPGDASRPKSCTGLST